MKSTLLVMLLVVTAIAVIPTVVSHDRESRAAASPEEGVSSAEKEEEHNPFYGTPAWSIPVVMAIVLALSVLVERLIGGVRNWLEATNRLSLLAVVEQTKEELKIVGLMSLVLKDTSNILSTICVPPSLYKSEYFRCNGYGSRDVYGDAVPIPPNSCKKKGYRPVVKYEGLEELHRFIFVTAAMHMFLSCLTLFLAYRKVRKCRAWEDEDQLHMAVPLIERRIPRRNAFCMCMTYFFRQFERSIDRAEYLTLRRGFIRHHNLPPTFDFYDYTIRSIGEQFQELVVISIPLRILFAVMLLISSSVYNNLFLVQPLSGILLLLVGTKLQHIVATFVRESAEPTFRPRAQLFWLQRPKWVLVFIKLIHFQTSFLFASFLWFWWQFGLHSCILQPPNPQYFGLFMGFVAQCLNSGSAFPAYVLASQMTANPAEAQDLDQQLSTNTSEEDVEMQQPNPHPEEELQLQQAIDVEEEVLQLQQAVDVEEELQAAGADEDEAIEVVQQVVDVEEEQLQAAEADEEVIEVVQQAVDVDEEHPQAAEVDEAAMEVVQQEQAQPISLEPSV